MKISKNVFIDIEPEIYIDIKTYNVDNMSQKVVNDEWVLTDDDGDGPGYESLRLHGILRYEQMTEKEIIDTFLGCRPKAKDIVKITYKRTQNSKEREYKYGVGTVKELEALEKKASRNYYRIQKKIRDYIDSFGGTDAFVNACINDK